MGNSVKVLTYQERLEIRRMLNLGYTRSEIARRLGRGKNTIVSEVRRNGGDAYNAEEAQKKSDLVKIDRYKKLAEYNRKKKYPAWIERIEHLEMQVEILYDYIKEMGTHDKKH